MLNQPTLDTLRSMKLSGFAEAYAQQLDQPEAQRLSFDERLAMLVDRERAYRESRRQRRLLQQARLRQSACVEDIDYQHRGRALPSAWFILPVALKAHIELPRLRKALSAVRNKRRASIRKSFSASMGAVPTHDASAMKKDAAVKSRAEAATGGRR